MLARILKYNKIITCQNDVKINLRRRYDTQIQIGQKTVAENFQTDNQMSQNLLELQSRQYLQHRVQSRGVESRPLSIFGTTFPKGKSGCKVKPISYYRQTFPAGKTCPASSPDRAHRSIYPDSFESREEPLRKLCGIQRPSPMPMPAAPHTQSICLCRRERHLATIGPVSYNAQ